jgi:hypothetical protein
MSRLAPLALASALTLSACAAERPEAVVCYHLDAGDCLTVAAAVLAESDFESTASLVVVVPWRGCFPGAFCPLMRWERQPPRVATVGIRFADGGASVLRHVGDLEDRPLHVTDGPVNRNADTFIDAYRDTRGVLVLGTLPAATTSP